VSEGWEPSAFHEYDIVRYASPKGRGVEIFSQGGVDGSFHSFHFDLRVSRFEDANEAVEGAAGVGGVEKAEDGASIFFFLAS
jgi:hypothetical protein